MIRGIVGWSLQFRYIVVILALALMVFGFVQLGNMPVDALPEFSPPYVEIQTEALGLSAEEVEQMITVPMEQDLLAGVAWLDVIRSESVPGLSSVVVYFEPGTDLYRARQMVAERIAQSAVGLPHVSKPPTMIQPLSSSSRFMIIGLSSEQLSLIEMSVLARWTIAPRLMGVPGVAHVAIWGNRDRQLQVQVDPNQLRDMGVSLQKVVETTGNALWVSTLSYLEASTPGTGGFIDTPQQRLGVWHVLPISSPEELAQVPIKGTAWRLGDVASVVEDHQPLIGDAIINDNPNLLLVIEKLPETSTLEVTQGIEAALDALRPGFSEIDFDATLFRSATFIEMAMANLSRTLLISALLLILVLFLFSWGWRAALISMLSITISLLAALFLLYQRGLTLNVMVLAGLVVALGTVIDEAMIDTNRITQRLRQEKQNDASKSAQSVILDTLAETRSSILFTALITLLAVVPAFLVQGVSGSLLMPMILSYALAILAALVAALLVTPAMCLILFPNIALAPRQSPITAWLQQGYRQSLAWVLERPAAAYATVIILVLGGSAILPFILGDQLLPSFQEPYLAITVEAAPGTSHIEMNRIISQINQELKAIPGVNNVGAHVGRAVFGDKVVGINSAEIWVNLDSDTDFAAATGRIQEAMTGYTGLSTRVQTYLQQSLDKYQLNSSHPLTVRIFGEDHDILNIEAQKLEQELAGIGSISTTEIGFPVEEPAMEIEVDLAAAQNFGVKPGDVRRAAATLLSGIQVGSLFQEQKVFDVVVWSIPEIRNNLTNVRQLLIDTPGGGHVRLEDVADVRIASSPTTILREGVSPYIDIGIDVQGRSIKNTVNDIQAAITSYDFPLEYHAVVLSNAAAQQTNQQSILIAGIIAAIGFLLLLQASLRSWQLAIVLLLALPAALLGGGLATLLGIGNPPLIGVLGGILSIMGITLRNATMSVRHFQSIEDREGEKFGKQLILRGSQERLSSILMTALATGLALLPFLIFGDIPGNEIVRPISIFVLGGLLTSLLFSLFILPALYLRLGANREPDLGLDAAVESQPE